MIQADFNGKCRPVLTPTHEIEPTSHQPRKWRHEVRRLVLPMDVPNRQRDQLLDGLADQFPRLPAEHRLHCAIRRDDQTAGIHRGDALRGRLQQEPQFSSVFFVAPRLEHLLGVATRGHVQFNSGEPRNLSGAVAFDTTHALYPQRGSIGPHDAERGHPTRLSSGRPLRREERAPTRQSSS